jgi:hypothetical protein
VAIRCRLSLPRMFKSARALSTKLKTMAPRPTHPTVHFLWRTHRSRARRMCATENPLLNEKNMEVRVTYEHSLASAPEEFIVHVPSQLVTDIPANVPRALLPEFITELIIKRSATIGKVRNLRIL